MAETAITVLDQLDQLEEVVLEGSRIPFSGGRLVNEQDAIEVMDALRGALPAQLGQAVELIRQRDDFIGQARQQAEEIVAAGKRELERFLFERVYRSERVLEVRVPAQRRLSSLFAWYCDHPDALPSGFRRRADALGLRRSVADYIAGMTDRFLEHDHRRRLGA